MPSFDRLTTENELILHTQADKLVPGGDLILDLTPDIKTDKLIPDLIPNIQSMPIKPHIWVNTAPLIPDGDSIEILW